MAKSRAMNDAMMPANNSLVQRFWQNRSIRSRLVGGFLLVIGIVGGASVATGIRLINTRVYDQAYDAIRGHLGSAQSILDRDLEILRLKSEKIAALAILHRALGLGDYAAVTGIIRREGGLGPDDLILILAPDGRVLYRSMNPAARGDDLSHEDGVVRAAVKSGNARSAPIILSAERLMREGNRVAALARMPVKKTILARHDDRTWESRGFALESAAPVMVEGTTAAYIVIARLFNNNFEFVDRVRSIIFSGSRSFDLRDGTATVFMDNLRVSTNVTLPGGERAVGTMMSETVYDNIYVKKKSWVDRAFVVDRWYITAYAPIRDIDGGVIGTLYVGLREGIFIRTRDETLLIMGGVILGAVLISLILAFFLVRDIVMPVRSLAEAARSTAAGLYRKMPDIHGTNEMSVLASAFNTMVDAIRERDTILRDHTEKKIFQMQKLASLGRLSSGIAHELNNPLTGILTYASIMKETRGSEPFHDDLDVVIRETKRCKSIVQEMLNLARESRLEKERADFNRIIDEILSIIERSKQFREIDFVKHFDRDLPAVMVDVNQMKSVISNLMTNALDAMPGGGTITVTTALAPSRDSIVFSVADTGVGIPEEDIDRIFDPFYTTKEVGKGTGLGLSVTWGVVNNHAGTISIDSTVGKGTTFTIELPVSVGGEKGQMSGSIRANDGAATGK